MQIKPWPPTPCCGFDEITGIYPLFLVAYVVAGTFGLYFLARTADILFARHKFYQQLKLKLKDRIAAVTLPRPPGLERRGRDS